MLERNCVSRRRDNFRWEIEMILLFIFFKIKIKKFKTQEYILKNYDTNIQLVTFILPNF